MVLRLKHVLACAALSSLLVPFLAAAQELRVLAHNSFCLSKPLLAQFEAQAAARFIEFMRSPAVQEALQTSMWMFPAEPGIARADVMRHAVEPASFDGLCSDTIAEKGADWVSRWIRVVLK